MPNHKPKLGCVFSGFTTLLVSSSILERLIASGPVFEFFIMNATNGESTPLLNLFQIEAGVAPMAHLLCEGCRLVHSELHSQLEVRQWRAPFWERRHDGRTWPEFAALSSHRDTRRDNTIPHDPQNSAKSATLKHINKDRQIYTKRLPPPSERSNISPQL